MSSALLVALLLTGGTQASDTPSRLEIIARRNETTPEAIVSCAPLGSVLERFQGLEPLLRGVMGTEPGPKASFWFGMLDPTRARTAGFNLDGSLDMAFWSGDKGLEFAFPFSGSDEQASALLQSLPSTGVERVAQGWRIRDEKSRPGHDLLAIRKGNEILLHSEAWPPRGADKDFPHLLQAWPTDAGCDLLILPGKEIRKLPDVAMALHLPTESRGLMARVSGLPAPEALSQANAVPLGGSSETRPTLVFTLGVPLLDLLEDPLLKKALAKADNIEKTLETVRSHVTIEPGLTVAAFVDGEHKDFVAVVGVSDTTGKPLSKGKLSKLIIRAARSEQVEKTGKSGKSAQVERIDKTTWSFPTKGALTYLMAGSGRLLVGSKLELLREVEKNTGEHWLSKDELDWGRGQAVGVWIQGDIPIPQMGPSSIHSRMGLRTRPGIWELQYENQAAPTPFETSFMGQAIKRGFESARLGSMRARQSELNLNVESIYTAQQIWHAEHETWIALPESPRSVKELDDQKLPWKSSAEWDKLGWKPSGDLMGTYWVELGSDGTGIIVHGMMDLDHDGVPAHMVRDSEGRRTLSPAGVW